MAKPVTAIGQYKEGEYIDQYGFPHKCHYVVAKLEVTMTDEFITWYWYGPEPIKDYIWVTECGRRFRKHTQVDYGPCDMPFTELDVEERIVFYRFNPKYKRFGLKPLIEEKPGLVGLIKWLNQ
jgi:hypothetical protein